MVKIDFEKNWNDVLIYGNFHALVIESPEYPLKSKCHIFLQGNYMGVAKIMSKKSLYFRHLDEHIAYLTLGKDLFYLKDHLLRQYNYDWLKWNNQKLFLLGLTWIKQTAYWKKVKTKTLNLRKKATLI